MVSKANKMNWVILSETYYKNMKKILKSVIVYLDYLRKLLLSILLKNNNQFTIIKIIN
ncbi:hypothetical protein HMPREF1092_00572 [Clostridium thermobutyricum]|uniref:Uncharacterized protein n=1 Tax=Clostridium thermobutyricum TaxID=29372 RepID=N9WJT4_9CLOT|nr:hypothetical protein HMPREF1092_00572 [Clostridium thermobutyricum]